MLSAALKIPESFPPPSKQIVAALKKWGTVFDVPWSWLAVASFIESTHTPSKVNRTPAAARKGGAWGLLQQMADEADYKTSLIRKFYSKPNKAVAAFWKGTPARRAAIKAALAHWRGNPSNLLNLDLNVMLAAWQFARLRRVFGKDFSTVMAAYHQGEGAVRRRVAAGQMPVDPARQPVGYAYVAKALAVRKQYATL